MATVEMSNVDLECGGGGSRRRGATIDEEEEEEEGSICFSDADDGSCYSQFYSTADGDGSYDDYSFACASEADEIREEAPEFRRASSVAARSDVSVEILENGVGEIKVNMGRVVKERVRDCRICHLSLFDSTSSNDSSSYENDGIGVAIELGCSCKGDLAAAHKSCAEAWFKIKGNKTCEICNSIARNIVSPNDVEQMQQTNEALALATNNAIAPASSTSETRSCLNGHRFLNFLLACMVFAFVISWLFHFNIPS